MRALEPLFQQIRNKRKSNNDEYKRHEIITIDTNSSIKKFKTSYHDRYV
jgi:hypothetical protein